MTDQPQQRQFTTQIRRMFAPDRSPARQELDGYPVRPVTFSAADERGRLTLTAEASAMGWPPGMWPYIFQSVDENGAELLFTRHHYEVKDNGELLWVLYQHWSLEQCAYARIWND